MDNHSEDRIYRDRFKIRDIPMPLPMATNANGSNQVLLYYLYRWGSGWDDIYQVDWEPDLENEERYDHESTNWADGQATIAEKGRGKIFVLKCLART